MYSPGQKLSALLGHRHKLRDSKHYISYSIDMVDACSLWFFLSSNNFACALIQIDSGALSIVAFRSWVTTDRH
jgi:hypothetical protein